MIKGEYLPDSVHHHLAGLGRYLRKSYVRWKTGRGKRGERVGASEHSHRFVHECHRTRVRIASTSVFGPVQHDRGCRLLNPGQMCHGCHQAFLCVTFASQPSLHPQVSTNIGREGLMVWGSIRLPSLWKVNDLLNIKPSSFHSRLHKISQDTFPLMNP